jgi:hypothetical protein
VFGSQQHADGAHRGDPQRRSATPTVGFIHQNAFCGAFDSQDDRLGVQYLPHQAVRLVRQALERGGELFERDGGPPRHLLDPRGVARGLQQ